MTKEELMQVCFLREEIERDVKRMEILESLATDMSPKLSDMPHSSDVADKTGRLGAEIADIQRTIAVNTAKYICELKRINDYITHIKDSEIRLILKLRYIDGLQWSMVSEALGNYGDGSTERKKIDRFLKK